MILMIYQKDSFKEYLLPNGNNMNYSIRLEKEIFHLKKDIELCLDITQNQWNIKESPQYILVSDGKIYKHKQLAQEEILHIKTEDKEQLDVIAVAHSPVFPIFQKYDISRMVEITVGKDEGNMISYQFMTLVSQNHCRIVKENGSFYVIDSSSNGSFSNGRRIKKQRLEFGDVINIFGLNILFLDGILGVAAHYGEAVVDQKYLKPIKPEQVEEKRREDVGNAATVEDRNYNRPPRYLPSINRESVEIEEPPSLQHTKQKPLIYTIGPSFTMALPMMLGCGFSFLSTQMSGRTSGAFMFTGIITAVASATLGVVWALANLKYAQREERENEQSRFNAYGNYLIETADDLKAKYEQNANALRDLYPSSKQCCYFDRSSNRIWNRNVSHEDFLFQRLGLGNIPFQVQIKIPKEKFSVQQDPLKQKPGIIQNDYRMLENVPVGIDLKQYQLWGIVGGAESKRTMNIVYNLVAQIAANNCYTDVKMVFIYDEQKLGDKEEWSFVKWLPHVWSEDKSTRYVAGNALEAGDVFYELANILRKRGGEENNSLSGKSFPKPWYVLFVSNPRLLEGELIAKYAYEPRETYGITTILLADYAYQLPNVCEHIIQNDYNFCGFYHAMDNTQEKHTVQFEQLHIKDMNHLAATLAGMEVSELESSGNIPASLEFLEMYQVKKLEELQVLERWRKSRTYHTMRVLVGKKMGGADAYLDIHEKYHGPHGLIAGTTGSGKSELLQTYILSLALNFSPDDIGFFIIDFKGGGMANLFCGLPHMVGQISNLSGNQVRRAMISIKSENVRRQRIFSEHGVNNINLYTRLYKDGEAAEPIPHLFIIIDEFAELKREEPEFMRELISVAQVGRSLGVHLILATQKPSGTVDDNIWSNSKFRLCLRVQDRRDSNDMLHKPDAAYLTQAGRCYLQVGNDELYELFQSGWSGAVYDENTAETKAEIAQMLTRTGKTAIVGSRMKIKRKEEERIGWYQKIIELIEQLTAKGSSGITVAQMSEEQKKELAVMVGAKLRQLGIDYEDSKANEKKMYDFLLLYAQSGENPAEFILRKVTEHNCRLPEVAEKTQLDALVEYLAQMARENGYRQTQQLWLPVLPEQLVLKELPGYEEQVFTDSRWREQDGSWKLEVLLGLYDDPENQSQLPVVLNLSENGHCAVCGTVVSGKSTFLQTFLFAMTQKYTPDYVNFYILDFSSHMLEAFGQAPQVGGILFENDIEAIGRFFHMIRRMMEERAKLFGGGNYSQYVRAYGVKLPAVVIVIDDYANFREKTDNQYDEDLVQLSAKGVGYGIFLVVSAAGFGTAQIPGRVADNMKNTVSLQITDKFKCIDIMRMNQISVLPEEGVAGRGLVNISGNILEFQTALAVEADDAYDRTKRIQESCLQMRKAWGKAGAKKIPTIPDKPILRLLEENPDYEAAISDVSQLPVGYRYADASLYAVNLRRTYCYLITGKGRTGKTTLLRVMMKGVYRKGAKMYVVEKSKQELRNAAGIYGAEYIENDEAQFAFFKELIPVFVERNKQKQKLSLRGLNEQEIYEEMQVFPPIFIFLSDLPEFIRSAYRPAGQVGTINGTLENIIEKGMYHNIYFIGCMNIEDASEMGGYRAFKNFVSYKAGVLLGGNAASQRIFNFQNIPYQETTKSLAKGIGLAASEEDDTAAVKIVFPEMGRESL